MTHVDGNVPHVCWLVIPHISILSPSTCGYSLPAGLAQHCQRGGRRPTYLQADGYGSIPIDTFLVGWTSIYQLFWGSLGTRVLTHPLAHGVHVHLDGQFLYCLADRVYRKIMTMGNLRSKRYSFFKTGNLRFAIAMFNCQRVMIIDTRSFQNLQNGNVARRRSDRAAPMHQSLWMFLDWLAWWSSQQNSCQ